MSLSTKAMPDHLQHVGSALARLKHYEKDLELVNKAVASYRHLNQLKPPHAYPKPADFDKVTADDFTFMPPQFFYGDIRSLTAMHVQAAERHKLWSFFAHTYTPEMILDPRGCPEKFKLFTTDVDQQFGHSGGSMAAMCGILQSLARQGWDGYVLDLLTQSLELRSHYDELIQVHPEFLNRL